MVTGFKAMRLLVLIGLMALIVCSAAVLYTHRLAHGTTVEEHAAYESGKKAGQQAPPGATLPTDEALNMTAQKYFEQQGPPEQLRNPSREADLPAFRQAFEKGYTDGFKKTHPGT